MSLSSKSLDEQLDWLTVDHDDLRRDLLERLSTPKYHPSMTIIDQWEQESIERIQQTAIHARRTLIDVLDQHASKTKKTLDCLTPVLRDARDNLKLFNENDIRHCANILQELKRLPEILVKLNKKNSLDGLTIDLRDENNLSNNLFISSYDLLAIIHHSSVQVLQNINPRYHSSQLDTHIYAQIQRLVEHN